MSADHAPPTLATDHATDQAPGHARPASLVLVTGTGTEVGKTWVSAAVLGALAGTRRVAARKPAQSFEPGDDDAGRTDAQVLAAVTGETPTDVCPPHRWYPVPLAPPMAAAALDLPPFTLDTLAAEITFPAGIDLGLVETAGGIASPLAATPARDVEADTGPGPGPGHGDDTVALIRLLDPDHVVLVADAGLGTINAVRLCTAALAHGTDPRAQVIVHLNRWDGTNDLHRRNRAWLAERDGLTVTVGIDDLSARLGPVR